MTKTEQNRLLAWRLKLLREVGVTRRSVVRTCRHFGISRKTFYRWKSRHRDTAKPDYAIVPGCRCARPERRPGKSSPRSCICGSVTTLGHAGLPLI
jgi:hypothetical protein